MNPTVPGCDLESIPCLGNAFMKNEQSLVGDPHDVHIVAQGSRSKRSGDLCLPCLVWKSTLFVFVSVLAHISILVPAVVSPDISWLYCRSCDISTSERLNNPAVSESGKRQYRIRSTSMMNNVGNPFAIFERGPAFATLPGANSRLLLRCWWSSTYAECSWRQEACHHLQCQSH